MTLRRQLLFLLLAASTLPVVAFAAIHGVRTRAVLEADASALLEARADHMTQAMDRFHERYFDFATTVAKLPGTAILLDAEARFGKAAEEARSTLWSLVHSDGYLLGVLIVDRNGTVTMTTRSHNFGAELGSEPIVTRALAGRDGLQPPQHALAHDRARTMLYATPVISAGGAVTGAVIVQVRADALTQAMAETSTRFGAGWAIALVDEAGLLIERRDSADAPADPLASGKLHERRQLTRVPWTLQLAASKSVILAPIRRVLWETVVLLAILAPLALVAGLWLARGVLRRTRSLAEAADAVAAGAMDVRAGGYADDELGLVARRFDEMAEAVATGRRELEARVLERTRKLELANETLQTHQLELRARAHELARANAVKTLFLANMSHELRTPLNAVISLSEVLLHEHAAPAPGHQKWLADIHMSGRHLLAIINDILDLSKIEAGRLSLSAEPLETDTVVAEARSLVEPSARRRQIRIRCDVDALPVRADPARLRQILVNLLSNAVKFSPEGEEVVVEARTHGELVRFVVSDHGRGVAASVRDRLFQPFVQGEEPHVKHYEGTGLGLAICKRLVEAHGGTIALVEGTTRGATFEFTIPVSGPADAS